eukprot:TRINITY_DN2929_c0_g1_i6.p1 TRINITY_DN2929_c0_g1~~TRINITY_DN2929_c0_g1_i6.p1  ORF type:complete len:242 (-),score=33.85 TRINITY_DN2929_c0_g1_i6:80-769(-)
MNAPENNETYQWLKQIGMTQFFINFETVGCMTLSDLQYINSEDDISSFLSISHPVHTHKLWTNIQLIQQQFSASNTPTVPSPSSPSTSQNTQPVQQKKKVSSKPKELNYNQLGVLQKEKEDLQNELTQLKQENVLISSQKHLQQPSTPQPQLTPSPSQVCKNCRSMFTEQDNIVGSCKKHSGYRQCNACSCNWGAATHERICKQKGKVLWTCCSEHYTVNECTKGRHDE